MPAIDAELAERAENHDPVGLEEKLYHEDTEDRRHAFDAGGREQASATQSPEHAEIIRGTKDLPQRTRRHAFVATRLSQTCGTFFVTFVFFVAS